MLVFKTTFAIAISEIGYLSSRGHYMTELSFIIEKLGKSNVTLKWQFILLDKCIIGNNFQHLANGTSQFHDLSN